MALISQRAYAKHRGVSLAAVQKAIKAGRIRTAADGKIDAAQADADWERNTGPRQQPGKTASSPASPKSAPPPAAEPMPGGLDYARARAVRENYMARLAKIDFEERSGKLVSRDEVQVAAFNKFRTFRDGMLNIPDRVSAMLAAESDASKVHGSLTTEIRKALLEFADGANS
jgi:pyruvate/2-oxoglutarate dehydrogenase complex dihydrolipoamide acyltransferase (E2) component